MNFKVAATAAGIISFILGMGYLFAGGLVVGRWQIEPSIEILLPGRRMGCLYLCISIIFMVSRSAPVSRARTAISAGAAIGLAVLSFTGIFEFISGNVGATIFMSVVLELLLAIGFIIVLFKERKTTQLTGKD